MTDHQKEQDRDLIATLANALERALQHAEALSGICIADECKARNLTLLLNIAGGTDGLAGARLSLVTASGEPAELLFEIIGAPDAGDTH